MLRLIPLFMAPSKGLVSQTIFKFSWDATPIPPQLAGIPLHGPILSKMDKLIVNFDGVKDGELNVLKTERNERDGGIF